MGVNFYEQYWFIYRFLKMLSIYLAIFSNKTDCKTRIFLEFSHSRVDIGLRASRERKKQNV